MTGTKDPQVYEYAVSKGFDAIFTRDLRHKDTGNPFRSNDLTTIATAYAIECVFEEQTVKKKGNRKLSRRNLPLVIRFQGMNASEKSILEVLDKFEPQIRYALEFRPSPYITVSKNSVRAGPSYEDIFDEFFNSDKRKAINDFKRTRIERWTESWTQRIIKNYGGKQLKQKEIAAIRKQTAERAEACKQESPKLPRRAA